MAEPDSFDQWIDEFRRQVVDPAAERIKPTLSTPEARQAQDAFDTWWKAEQQPAASAAAPAADPAAATPPAPTVLERSLPQKWPEQVERLADDRARLQQKMEAVDAENRALRERLSRIQSEIADFETRLSRSRQGYEEHIQRLEAQLKMLQDQAGSLRSDKIFLENALKTSEEQRQLQGQLAQERQRADLAENQIFELRQQIIDIRQSKGES